MIAIVKYNAGSTLSLSSMLTRLGYDNIITGDGEEISKASKIILPGSGEAAPAIKYLRDKELDRLIPSLKQPVLGICLGFQLMCRYTEETKTNCLGIFNSDVRIFPKHDRLPHMGWNDFISVWGDIFTGISRKDNVYYAHSHYAGICSVTTAICDYILPFSAAMKKDNFYGVQFLPEKSALAGETILRNFLEL